MLLPRFEDKFPKYTTGGYLVTNEDPQTFSELLGEKRFQRTASICSGGEIPLGVMLPRTEQECIFIDHSYSSLGGAWIKALMLSAVGPKEFLNLLRDAKAFYAEAQNRITDDVVPEALRQFVKLKSNAPSYADSGTTLSKYTLDQVFTYFSRLPFADLERSAERIDKALFVHGDVVQDLPECGDGTFEALYISNAMEHQGRKSYGRHYGPRLPQFEALVRTGGLLLATGSLYTTKESPTSGVDGFFKVIADKRGQYTGWQHKILERTEGRTPGPVDLAKTTYDPSEYYYKPSNATTTSYILGGTSATEG